MALATLRDSVQDPIPGSTTAAQGDTMKYTLDDLLAEILSLQESSPEAMVLPLQIATHDGTEDIRFVAFGVYDECGEDVDGDVDPESFVSTRIIMDVRTG